MASIGRRDDEAVRAGHPPSGRLPQQNTKKRAVSSKYDVHKVKVWLGDNRDHYYILSRFLISRSLTITKIPSTKAVKIALELKKQFVDQNKLSVSQAELEETLFSLMKAKGYGQPYIDCYRTVSEFYQLRQPLVIILCGAPCTGKSTIAQQLAARLNMPNVMQTDVICELMRCGASGALPPQPPWTRTDGLTTTATAEPASLPRVTSTMDVFDGNGLEAGQGVAGAGGSGRLPQQEPPDPDEVVAAAAARSCDEGGEGSGGGDGGGGGRAAGGTATAAADAAATGGGDKGSNARLAVDSWVLSEFRSECRAVRRALEGDFTKALKDGKPLIVEGVHLDLGQLLVELQDLGIVLLPMEPVPTTPLSSARSGGRSPWTALQSLDKCDSTAPAEAAAAAATASRGGADSGRVVSPIAPPCFSPAWTARQGFGSPEHGPAAPTTAAAVAMTAPTASDCAAVDTGAGGGGMQGDDVRFAAAAAVRPAARGMNGAGLEEEGEGGSGIACAVQTCEAHGSMAPDPVECATAPLLRSLRQAVSLEPPEGARAAESLSVGLWPGGGSLSLTRLATAGGGVGIEVGTGAECGGGGGSGGSAANAGEGSGGTPPAPPPPPPCQQQQQQQQQQGRQYQKHVSWGQMQAERLARGEGSSWASEVRQGSRQDGAAWTGEQLGGRDEPASQTPMQRLGPSQPQDQQGGQGLQRHGPVADEGAFGRTASSAAVLGAELANEPRPEAEAGLAPAGGGGAVGEGKGGGAGGCGGTSAEVGAPGGAAATPAGAPSEARWEDRPEGIGWGVSSHGGCSTRTSFGNLDDGASDVNNYGDADTDGGASGDGESPAATATAAAAAIACRLDMFVPYMRRARSHPVMSQSQVAVAVAEEEEEQVSEAVEGDEGEAAEAAGAENDEQGFDGTGDEPTLPSSSANVEGPAAGLLLDATGTASNSPMGWSSGGGGPAADVRQAGVVPPLTQHLGVVANAAAGRNLDRTRSHQTLLPPAATSRQLQTSLSFCRNGSLSAIDPNAFRSSLAGILRMGSVAHSSRLSPSPRPTRDSVLGRSSGSASSGATTTRGGIPSPNLRAFGREARWEARWDASAGGGAEATTTAVFTGGRSDGGHAAIRAGTAAAEASGGCTTPRLLPSTAAAVGTGAAAAPGTATTGTAVDLEVAPAVDAAMYETPRPAAGAAASARSTDGGGGTLGGGGGIGSWSLPPLFVPIVLRMSEADHRLAMEDNTLMYGGGAGGGGAVDSASRTAAIAGAGGSAGGGGGACGGGLGLGGGSLVGLVEAGGRDGLPRLPGDGPGTGTEVAAAAAAAPAAVAKPLDEAEVLRRSRSIQEYLCSFEAQGVPIVGVRYGYFGEALDNIHEYVLMCIQAAMEQLCENRACEGEYVPTAPTLMAIPTTTTTNTATTTTTTATTTAATTPVH